MIQISTATSRKTYRVEIVIDHDGVSDSFEPVLAEVHATGLMAALVDKNDDADAGVRFPSGFVTMSVKNAKEFANNLFRASLSASFENNFADFIEGELNLSRRKRLKMLLRFREFNSRKAEDVYERDGNL